MSRRTDRVAEAIRQELAKLVPTLKHPEIGFLTFTKVELSTDLKNARAFVSVLPIKGHEDPQASIRALNHSKRFLRGQIGNALPLRVVPDLDFALDTSQSRVADINNLIRQARASDASATQEKAEDAEGEEK